MNPKPPLIPQTLKPLGHHRDARAASSVARPVAAFARTDPAGHLIKPHSHDKDQLVYAIRGVMTIQALDSIWTIPPSYGLWIPAGVEHSVKMDTEVEMRTLYFSPGIVELPENQCQVRSISPLLRELIIRAITIEPLYCEAGPDGRLMQVIIDELHRQDIAPLGIRLPTDKRLLELCRHVLGNLDQSETIRELGRRAGLSERSVLRRFPLETGVTFKTWRQQARLMRAFSLVERKTPLGIIATELGYSSVAAFAKMFKKTFGRTPRQMLLNRER